MLCFGNNAAENHFEINSLFVCQVVTANGLLGAIALYHVAVRKPALEHAPTPAQRMDRIVWSKAWGLLTKLLPVDLEMSAPVSEILVDTVI